MKRVVEKLRRLEGEISSRKGPFSLFALLLREEAPDRWDLVVSAPWLEKDIKKSMDYLSGELRSLLTLQELLTISRIVIIEQENPGLEAIHKAIPAEQSVVEISQSNLFGLQIERGYIITSKSLGATAGTGAA
ncbi:MAG: hypothetical protein M1358_19210 [Chloroflexi bacterium]|nr:hypothetical protein [Chloroflexota bacterium]